MNISTEDNSVFSEHLRKRVTIMTNTAQTITAADVGSVTALVGTPIPAPAPSKAAIARGVFARCYAMPQVPQRKDIIAMAMKEADLSNAGAATYLQTYKKDNKLTKADMAAVAPAVVAEVKETTAA